MEIVGNGVDIIKNSRIKNLIKNPKFLSRIFSVNEIKDSKKLKIKQIFLLKDLQQKKHL